MAFRRVQALLVCGAVLALPLWGGSTCGAFAEDLPAPAPTLPSLALNPAPPPTKSIWTGFYVGTELFAATGGHGGGHFGGDVDVGYNHEFDSNIVLGVQASVGFAPYTLAHSPLRGYDFATTSLKVGYDMGRLMPFVTTGVVLAKPNTLPGATYTNASDSLNNLFSSPGSVKGLASVGAGFDYAVTNNFRVGVAVTVTHGNGWVTPPVGF